MANPVVHFEIRSADPDATDARSGAGAEDATQETLERAW
jgi:hypothetical protein